jgi:hypothetical protein
MSICFFECCSNCRQKLEASKMFCILAMSPFKVSFYLYREVETVILIVYAHTGHEVLDELWVFSISITVLWFPDMTLSML